MPIKTWNSKTSMPTVHLSRCEALRDGEIEIEEGLKKTIDSCIHRVGKDNQKAERCYALLMGLYALQTLIEDEGRPNRIYAAQIAISNNRGYPSHLNVQHQKTLDDFAENKITHSQALIILGYVLSNGTSRFRNKQDWLPLAPALKKIFRQGRGRKGEWEDASSTPTEMVINRMRMRKKYLEDNVRRQKTAGEMERLYDTARMYFQIVQTTFQQ